MVGSQNVLRASGLRVRLDTGEAILEGIDLEVRQGEIVGLVGESGSGKSTTAVALLGFSTPGARIEAGELTVAGQARPLGAEMREARGRDITYVPQNPGKALNPAVRVGGAVAEMLKVHRPDLLSRDAVERCLETVGLPGTDAFSKRFPHQLSGGQQQRVCIATALACGPPIVVLDEPTTGLDVVTQAHILEELVRLRDEQGVGMLYVTHDLSVVAQIADRIIVMYAGRIVEEGPTAVLLRRPRHPYTRGLIASIPDHAAPSSLQPMPGVAVAVGERPAGCSFAPRCAMATADLCDRVQPELTVVSPGHVVSCHNWEITPEVVRLPAKGAARADEAGRRTVVLEVRALRAEYPDRFSTVVAARDVNFQLQQGQSLALVGESGSGKTTIARAIAGLHTHVSGEIRLDDELVPPRARNRKPSHRRFVQLISQDPADALNPRHSVRESVGRPAKVLRGMKGRALDSEVALLLESVRLPSRLATRYPEELSGGERQRVAIARALAARPTVLVCDEITSALDVSVQAAVLDVLTDLRTEMGVSLLFITHDLGVVSTIADQTMVLENGIVCEHGPTRSLLTAPEHPYTRQLLASAPSLAEAIAAWTKTDAAPIEAAVAHPRTVGESTARSPRAKCPDPFDT